LKLYVLRTSLRDVRAPFIDAIYYSQQITININCLFITYITQFLHAAQSEIRSVRRLYVVFEAKQKYTVS